MKRFAHLALIPAAAVLCAAKGYVLVPEDAVIGQPIGGALPGTERTVAANEAFLHASVNAAPVATVEEDMSLSLAGHQAMIRKDAELMAFAFIADPPGGLSKQAAVYCAPSTQSQAEMGAKAVLGAAAFGMFSGVSRTRLGSRACLVDADHDGRAEFAIESGAQRDSDITPVAISPVPLKFGPAKPHPRITEGRVVFVGSTAGRSPKLLFGFDAMRGDGPGVAVGLRTAVKVDQLPVAMEVQGAHFTVLAYDAVKKAVRIRIDSTLPEAPFWPPSPRGTMIMPVYIPR